MTKEELLEDVNIGDIVKIYTESNEIFEGKIADFGASGLKISLIGTNKSKRIVYGRILEYDIGEEADSSSVVHEHLVENDPPAGAKKQVEKKNADDISVWQISKTTEETHTFEETQIAIAKPTMQEEKTFVVDRNNIFQNNPFSENLSEIRKYWEEKISSSQKKEVSRILDILAYARKIHEFTLKSDRVTRAIAEYKKLIVEERAINVFIALIYHELGEYHSAIEYYHEAGAYDLEFILSTKYGLKKDLFEIAVLATEYNDENEAVEKWLCDYAVKNNDYAVISHMLGNAKDNLVKILLYWYADKAEINALPDKSNLYTDINCEYLQSLVSPQSDKSVIDNIISSVEVASGTVVNSIVQEEPQEEIFKGIVSFYNRDGGYGNIKNLNGGSLYFHIRQVKDVELQRILATDNNYKRRVTYTRGINFKGQIAADSVQLDIDYEDEPAEDEYAYEGFLDDYLMDQERGIIRSGNKSYNFVFSAIKDPLLYAEIMSRPYSVLDLEVRFNARDHKSKKTKKASKIAFDIVGKKTYSQTEIKDFISQRLVSKSEVDEWLGIKSDKNHGFFREVAYEPLDPISLVVEESTQSVITPVKTINAVNLRTTDTRKGEKQAVALMLPKNQENPFASLRKDNSGKKYFQDAHRYMVGRKNSNGDIIGVDLDKAEDLFIKAIQASDQTNSSVANLVNIYIKRGNEYIDKGLQLLESYGYLFPPEKLTNLRIQLIDKSGNNEALELILRSAIPNCVKRNTVWQYMTKLAGIYYKEEKLDLAIEWFEKSLEYLGKNRNEFSQYQLLRNNNIRPLIIARFRNGDKEIAIRQAKQFLLSMPEDYVIRSIVDGTFGLDETKAILDDFDELDLQYEDELFAVDGEELSRYLTDKLHEVDLSSTFNKVNDVYTKTQDGIFIGNSSDVKRAVDFIQSSILRKNKTGLSAEYRSAIYIGIAKIIFDSRNNNNIDNDSKLAIDEVKKYVGRYARYTADALVEKYATIDSIRYLYIQALRYLVKEDSGNIIASTNMLVASFFTEGRTLTDELHEMKAHVYNYDYYNKGCISIKDFLIATFMLQEKQEYVNAILNKIYESSNLREKAIAELQRMTSQERSIVAFYDFESLWKIAKGKYYNILEQIGKEIADSVNEYHMVESIRQHVMRIEELMHAKMLWNQDEAILRTYLTLLSTIGNTFDKYTVEEKIDGFRGIELEIEKLKNDIENATTELSYDYVYSRMDDLKYVIRMQFDDLYLSSTPECQIYLSNDSIYVNEKTAEIAITFSNAQDKQDADAVDIELEGSDGATFVRCEKKFTSIRSGEEQDYMAVFTLNDHVINDGQFEITVKMKYDYHESVESIKTTTLTEILPVNITDKENFIRIENKYDRIFRGSGVDVTTPELFKGRNELIDSICASMSTKDGIMTKNRGIILWGQRRVGKNSVKDYLKEKIRKEYPEAYIIIELGSIGKCRNLREVLITIINKTEDTLMTEYEDIYEKLVAEGMSFDGYALEKTDNYMPKFARFMYRLSARLKKISGDSEKNIPLYFLDEFSYLYEWIEKGEIDGKEFMRFWKSFIQDYGICSIIIAQDNIPVWKSRYENEFACMNHDNEITYLDFEGAKELICEPCQRGDKVLFAPDAVKLIYDWTKGSAYLIVIFCKHIIDYLNDNYTEKATKTIVQIVFEREFIDEKEMFKSEDFEPQIQDVANVGHEGEVVNQLNELLLKDIASATITASQVKIEDLQFFKVHDEEQARKVFNRLKDRKIIEVERDMYCSISMPLLKFYMLREQSLLNREVLNKLTR
ncbi:MAG: hypothetical protein MR936_01095 [Eubacterium sp.]|nr:hypothetical protein [Eubacterium sp.]